MKSYSRFIMLAAAIALAVSGLIYVIHYAIFQDVHHIFIYMVGDFAFLPLEVFIVVIVIERILNGREKRLILNKLNMVVGAFYSEVGNHLLGSLLTSFEDRQNITSHLAISEDWQPADFKKAAAFALTMEHEPSCGCIKLEELRDFLINKRHFLLRLMENPNLLENEEFTDLLWAVFHLAEELEARKSVEGLPESDLEHLSGDIKRLYGQLIAQWLAYTEHLKNKYPYLFSLTLRIHPFQEEPSAVVE